MDRYTRVNGISVQIKRMEEAYKYGLMDPDMMAFGKMMLLKVMEDLYMLREMSMRASGKMTKLMATVYTLTITEIDMLETGKKINNMEKESKYGQMIHSTMAYIKME